MAKHTSTAFPSGIWPRTPCRISANLSSNVPPLHTRQETHREEEPIYQRFFRLFFHHFRASTDTLLVILLLTEKERKRERMSGKGWLGAHLQYSVTIAMGWRSVQTPRNWTMCGCASREKMDSSILKMDRSSCVHSK